MKFFTPCLVFVIFTYFSLASSKSLKDYYGNKVSVFKGQRKTLASPVVNGIHDNYTRSKRQTPKAVLDFQNILNKAKQECVRNMRMSPTILGKSLMYEENPTPKEKCLISCILKKTKLMDKSNKLSTQHIARLAGNISNNNALVISFAVATANNCNNGIKATTTCEAASEINKCIANEMKIHKLKLSY